MKQLYFSLLLLFSVQAIQAQIVNIGDPQLKAAILNTGIDVNNDGEIQLSEASALTGLNVLFSTARTFEGIEHFTNLTSLSIGSSTYGTDAENIDLRALVNLENLTLSNFSGDVNLSGLSNLKTLEASLLNPNRLNITGLTSLKEFSFWNGGISGPNYYVNHLVNLKQLDVDGRDLTWLDVGKLTQLEELFCYGNHLTELDLSNLSNLSRLSCSSNQLTTLDISNTNINGYYLGFGGNPITALNIHDGNITNIGSLSGINLQTVCCDASELSNIQTLAANEGYTGVTFDTNCPTTPTTPYYTIQGKNMLDVNGNGCDAGDGFLDTVEYTISNGTHEVTVFTDKFGNYEFSGKAGTYTITPTIPNTSYYTISPASVTVHLPADGTTVVHDFCVTPNGPPIVTSLPLELKNDMLAQTTIDTNGDGEIQITEAQSVTQLSIKSPIVKGLDDFVNLEKLVCSPENNGSSYDLSYTLYLDVSPLVNLKELAVGGNRLATLDVSQNVLLEKLSCGGNLLNALQLTNNINLKRLVCGNAGISSDPLSPNLNRNSFKTLDLSNNPLLEYVYCSYATIENLILGNNTNLKQLDCANSGLTTLDVTQLPNLEQLICGVYDRLFFYYPLYILDSNPNQLTSLDISQNSNLWYLNCSGNLITNLDTSAVGTSLTHVYCNNNPLNTLDVSQNTSLQILACDATNISSLDLSSISSLRTVSCSDNALTTLDISQNPNLVRLDCRDNQITELFVKNGKNFNTFVTDDYWYYYEFLYSGNPVAYICADDFEIEEIQNRMPSNINANVNTYCSFTPGGDFYTIQGTVRFDTNGNGCDSNDDPYQYLNLTVTNGSNETAVATTLNDGSYTFYASDDDTYTVTPILENPAYFTVSPASITVDFPTDASPLTQDFCIAPNGTHNDVDVTILPLNSARPGFDANYKLVYKNKGNTVASGTINLIFEDDFMDLLAANPFPDAQAVNSLSWNYTNLLPFEVREIAFSMNLNTPTDASFPLNGDDVLDFEAMITPVAGDETMDDNTFTLSQLVVNSFDPNDKNCLQGNEVTTEFVGKYVDYMIRFENTGTANAINVVVKDEIDATMFDPNSLIVTSASHAVMTRMTNTNTVEFIFENINLPFDDALNDGYVTFKIKTLPTLMINDTFENDAEIFFDYNFPIQTNKSITVIKNILSRVDVAFENFEMYPNPVKDVLTIKTQEAIESLKIYDISGKFILEEIITGAPTTIELQTSTLALGTYFVKIKTESGLVSIKKLVKG
ncbi:MAG: T9SS type A sorting domain-containing protein [Bacteroidota bacterium]